MKFQMYLNNMKVWKYSREIGPNTFIMRLASLCVRREVGLRWQEFGKKWVRDEQIQRIEIQLKRLRGNLWEITVPKEMEPKVREHVAREYGA